MKHPALDRMRTHMQQLSVLLEDERKLQLGECGQLCTVQYTVTACDGCKLEAFSVVPAEPIIVIADQEQEEALITQFSNFGYYLRPASTTKTFGETTFSPRQLLQWMKQDTRPLARCMLALGTGHTTLDRFKTYHQSALFAAQLASDLVLRLVDPQHEVGHAIRALDFAFDQYAAKNFRDLACRFRCLMSGKHARQRDAEEFKKFVESMPTLGPRDLVMLIADNIQYKVKFGDQAGTFKHFVLVCLRIIPESQPIENGYIRDDKPLHERLDRIPKDWKRFCGQKKQRKSS